MKTKRWMRYLAVAMALTLVMSTPLQASEFVPEDTTEVVAVSSDDAVSEEEFSPEEDTLIGEADPEEASTNGIAPIAESPEDEPELKVTGIDEVTLDGAEAATIGTTSATLRERVWLHVVNGNFSTYDGKDVSDQAVVDFKLDCYNGRLPEDIEERVTVTRTHGTFEGWYTEAPTEELQSTEGGYSVWHTVRKNGKKINPGDKIPSGVYVLYAAFDDTTEVKEEDKLVRFYLDWNGIDGRFGHCLTCTRGYKDGQKPKFTAEDAAVYGLNYGENVSKELRDEFDKAKTSEEKWKVLEKIWPITHNGYKFTGWSTEPTGGKLITSDTDIKDGMSFYAHWTKEGTKLSSEDFERVDPAAGPLEAIRIVAGAGTKFVSGTLGSSKHAKAGESFALNLFYTPVRAEIKDITWSLSVVKGGGKTVQEVLLNSRNVTNTTVKAGGTVKVEEYGLEVKAEGCILTIQKTNSRECGITVRATAKGKDDKEFTSLSDATLNFVHRWDEGEQEGTPTCTEGATITYKCTACGETKEEEVSPLGHVYNLNPEANKERNSNSDSDGIYYTVTQTPPPTCTEEGLNTYTYKCLRCGDEVKDVTKKVPALGHDWEEVGRTPASCNEDMVTERCKRNGCLEQKVSLVPAYHPEFHQWKETRRDHNSCKQDTVYETCTVCGETQKHTEAAENPHQYAYDSSMRNDCQTVTYTFKCVYGCGATEVMLKKEEGHTWGEWKYSASVDRVTGDTTRTRTHTCSLCGKTETEPVEDALANSMSKVKSVSTYVAAPANKSKKAAAGKITGWKKVGKKEYYYVKGMKQTGWKKIGKKKYYFGKNGVMQTGWKKIGKKKYYFGKDGVMRTGKQKIGKKKYNFGKNGALKK